MAGGTSATARTRIWHTHYLPEEEAATACFYRRTAAVGVLTVLVGLALLAPPLFTPEPRALRALWAMLPLALLHVVHGSMLFVFLVRTPRDRCDVVRMGCTLELRHSHFRRSTCVSAHPLLHKWYWAAVLLYTPLVLYAVVLLSVLWLTGALGWITALLSLLATAVAYCYARTLSTRFYDYCVDGSIAHALPTNLDLGRYTTRRAQSMIEQELLLNRSQLATAAAGGSGASTSPLARANARADSGDDRRRRRRR